MKRMLWKGCLLAGMLGCVSAFGQTEPVAPDAGGADAEKDEAKKTEKAEKPAEPQRESVITAERIEFDNKEGIILFDDNVLVDDAQFIMRSDRLLVFMEGTNDVQQIMAVGNVSITNENRSASCDKAVYTKKDGQIVMTGKAKLAQGEKGGEVTGDRITFWLDDERMEVYPGRVVLPPGTFNKADTKKLIPGME